MTDPQGGIGADDEYIWVLGLAGDEDDGSVRSRFFRRDEARVGRRRVPAQQLHDNVEGFVRSMSRAIAGVPSVLAGYSIDSIELSAEVSASGTVSLLGTGGELSGTGGIRFKLTRLKDDSNQRPPELFGNSGSPVDQPPTGAAEV